MYVIMPTTTATDTHTHNIYIYRNTHTHTVGLLRMYGTEGGPEQSVSASISISTPLQIHNTTLCKCPINVSCIQFLFSHHPGAKPAGRREGSGLSFRVLARIYGSTELIYLRTHTTSRCRKQIHTTYYDNGNKIYGPEREIELKLVYMSWREKDHVWDWYSERGGYGEREKKKRFKDNNINEEINVVSLIRSTRLLWNVSDAGVSLTGVIICEHWDVHIIHCSADWVIVLQSIERESNCVQWNAVMINAWWQQL